MQINVVHTLHPDVIALLEKFLGAEKVTKQKTSDNGQVKKEPAAIVQMENKEGAAPVIKIEDIRATFQQKKDQGKRENVKTLLTEFGVDKITSLAPDQYPAFYQKLQAI